MDEDLLVGFEEEKVLTPKVVVRKTPKYKASEYVFKEVTGG